MTRSSQESSSLVSPQNSSTISSNSGGFIKKKFLGIACDLGETIQKEDQNKWIRLVADSRGEYDDYKAGQEGHLSKIKITKRVPATDSSGGYIVWEPKVSCSFPSMNFRAYESTLFSENENKYYKGQLNVGHYGKPGTDVACDYLSIRARNSFPKVDSEVLYILYPEYSSYTPKAGWAGPYAYKSLGKYEIKVSGYEKLKDANEIRILSATSLAKSMIGSWESTLNGQMVVDQTGQFVGFANVQAKRDISIQVTSALSPSLKKDLNENYFGHENFESQGEMPLQRSKDLKKSTCENPYSECELVEKKKN